MSAVAQAPNTYAQIELLVRRLTASASESSLPSVQIQQQVNVFYSADFPYAIKLDQMRDVYSFYTAPYIDRYALDVNFNQGVRGPLYVDGIQGQFFKDRGQFFNMWPRWPTLFQQGGSTSSFSFTLGATPILSREINIGGTFSSGVAFQIGDDGNGNLQLEVPNPVVSVPAQTSTAPGMKNLNTANPGQTNVTTIGTVNYVTAAFAFTFPSSQVLLAGTTMRIHVSQYQPGKPYTMLFWNNEFTIRPVPKYTHKIEIETYLTPVQFMLTTDTPILNQWVQYISYGVSMEILRQRQDMDGVANLMEGFRRQEALVLERQGVEEIGQRNTTIFSGTQQTQGYNNGFGQGWY